MKTFKQDTEEFLNSCELEIKCIVIKYGNNQEDDEEKICDVIDYLPENYTPKQYICFMNDLKYCECADYVDGTIWFKDGSWAYYEPIIDEEPELYGYSWHLYECPEIPFGCKRSE